MNTPVNVELAKSLIKEGIDHKNFYYWNMVNRSGEWKLDTRIWEDTCDYYEAPTIADAVMWLYEKHGIFILADPAFDFSGWTPRIFMKEEPSDLYKGTYEYSRMSEAYESAIQYCLVNLV